MSNYAHFVAMTDCTNNRVTIRRAQGYRALAARLFSEQKLQWQNKGPVHLSWYH